MPNNNIDAKVALVTGAARRMGAEIARTLHTAGMNVLLHYNASEDEAVQLSAEFNQQRAYSAVAIHADLQDQKSRESLIKQGIEVWQRLDVLINNASRFYRTPWGAVTDEAWEDLMTSNLKGPFFLAQAAAPHLMKQEGSVINITDIHAERPLKDYSVYCLSKSGLSMMTKVLARELGPKVRVNAVAPGSITWPEGENALSDTQKQKIIDRTILQRSGKESDIAKAVLFFIRDADYITGQTLVIDGGRMLLGVM